MIQEVLTFAVVFAAVAFVIWRFTSRGPKQGSKKGPDVPLDRLKKKKPKDDGCH